MKRRVKGKEPEGKVTGKESERKVKGKGSERKVKGKERTMLYMSHMILLIYDILLGSDSAYGLWDPIVQTRSGIR